MYVLFTKKRRMNKYLAGSLVYGFVRGVYFTDKVKSRDHERMLFGTRILYVTMCTAMAPLFSVYYLIADMDYVDETYILKKPGTRNTELFPFPGFRLENSKGQPK